MKRIKLTIEPSALVRNEETGYLETVLEVDDEGDVQDAIQDAIQEYLFEITNYEDIE